MTYDSRDSEATALISIPLRCGMPLMCYISASNEDLDGIEVVAIAVDEAGDIRVLALQYVTESKCDRSEEKGPDDK